MSAVLTIGTCRAEPFEPCQVGNEAALRSEYPYAASEPDPSERRK